jgi:hypothetical protein
MAHLGARAAVVLAFFFAGCAAFHRHNSVFEPVGVLTFPEPGQCMPQAVRGYVYTAHRGGDFCATTVVYQGLVYDIDVACDADIVTFVHAFDSRFRTDGLSPSSTLRDAFRAGGVLMPETMPDRCEIALPSGWTAVFDRCSEEPANVVRSFEKNLPQDEVEAIVLRSSSSD